MENELKFDDRELNEIWHAMFYAAYMSHGTVGHNMLLLIAKLAKAQGFMLSEEDLLGYVKPDGTFVYAFAYFKVPTELP